MCCVTAVANIHPVSRYRITEVTSPFERWCMVVGHVASLNHSLKKPSLLQIRLLQGNISDSLTLHNPAIAQYVAQRSQRKQRQRQTDQGHAGVCQRAKEPDGR